MKWRNGILLLLVFVATIVCTSPGTAEINESYAALYQAYPSGGTVVWHEAPLASNYKCTLYIINLNTGDAHWVSTSTYTFLNSEDILFQFVFDFGTGSWTVVGNPNLIYTSGCEAWTNAWGTYQLFSKSVFLDFRDVIYIPLVLK
jgi:hypothetical protein